MTQTNGRRRRRKDERAPALAWPALLISLLLILAACGSDDGEATATADPTAAPAATDTDTGDVESSDADGAADGVPDSIADLASETGTATVTIGDETYEFTLAGTATIDETTYVGRCETLFGMIVGSGFATDGRDITVDMEVPPVDWESYEDDRYDPPAIGVKDNEANASWVANQGDDFVVGSGVNEFEQDEMSASGSATFVNQWDPDSDPVEGSFEVDCAG